MVAILIRRFRQRKHRRRRKHAPPKSSALELLTPVETISKLEETNIILAYLVDQMSAGIDLAKSKFVVILVVKYV